MQHDSIISELKTNCPFPQFFEEPDCLPMLGTGYRRKIVHIRADYDGRKWCNTIWPYHDGLATPEIRKEVDAVYEAITSHGTFPDLPTLTAFCMSRPEAQIDKNRSDEFSFYLDGELCYYWLHCICRPKDYNLYLHAFLKDGEAVQHRGIEK